MQQKELQRRMHNKAKFTKRREQKEQIRQQAADIDMAACQE